MSPAPAFTYAAEILAVVDGDTLDVRLDLGLRVFIETRLRVAHVDCPEHGTPAGEAATSFVRGLLPPGTRVVVTTAKPDKYGRALADVNRPAEGNTTGYDLGTVLLATGHAVPYEGGTKTTNPDGTPKLPPPAIPSPTPPTP